MDAAKFHEKARILLESIPNKDLIKVDDQIRNFKTCSAAFYETPLRGWIVLWAQWQNLKNHAAKIRFTRELKAELLQLAHTDSSGGIMQGLRAAAPGGPEVNVVYEKDEPSPPFIKYKDKHKALLTILLHRLKQF